MIMRTRAYSRCSSDTSNNECLLGSYGVPHMTYLFVSTPTWFKYSHPGINIFTPVKYFYPGSNISTHVQISQTGCKYLNQVEYFNRVGIFRPGGNI